MPDAMEPEEYGRMAHFELSYWWYAGLHRLVLDALADEVAGQTQCRIVDAGCGTGGLLRVICREYPATDITGFDIANGALQIASTRAAGKLAQASIMAMPFPPNSFDAVTITDVLYIQGVDESAALTEAYRVLRPGGVLIINLPAFEWLRGEHDAAVHTARRYTRSQVRDLVAVKFTLERVFYWNASMLPAMLLVRRVLRRGHPTAPRSDFSELPGWLNRLLRAVVLADIRLCQALRVPFGGSIFCVARKRPTDPAR